jgi:hypothetical protein
MSTDILGLIDHKMKFPPDMDLPERLMKGVKGVDWPIGPSWSWDLDHIHETSFRVIWNDPYGCSLWIGIHSIVIGFGYSWYRAATDPETRTRVNLATDSIARFFGARQIMFLPDDLSPWFELQDDAINSGATFDSILSQLRQFQEPSVDIVSAINSDFRVIGYTVRDVPESAGE